MENQTPFYKQIWFLGGVAALVIFVLCFLGINYVSQPDSDEGPDVEEEQIATLESNEPLIMIARAQGWIEPDATEMTSIDAAAVDSLGEAFVKSNIKSFKEFRYFVGLKEIKSGAFAHADQLTEIVIPSQVVTIEDGALAYCPALESIAVDTANAHYDSRGDCNGIVCTWKGKLMLVAGCKNTKDERQHALHCSAGLQRLYVADENSVSRTYGIDWRCGLYGLHGPERGGDSAGCALRGRGHLYGL